MAGEKCVHLMGGEGVAMGGWGLHGYDLSTNKVGEEPPILLIRSKIGQIL